MYPAQTERIRQAILLRYRLLPHLYSLEYEAHRCGAPIMRPLVFEFREDPRTWNEGSEFLLGRDLLVANVLEKGAAFRDVYLPEGTWWYPIDLIRGKTVLPGMSWEERLAGEKQIPFSGGQTVRIPVTADSIPCFLREGGILPMAADQPMNMERDAVKDLCVWAVPDRSGKESFYDLYDDDGISDAHLKGEYRITRIGMKGWDQVELRFSGEGDYPDLAERIQVKLIRRDKSPLSVCLNGEELPRFLTPDELYGSTASGDLTGWYFDPASGIACIRYPNPGRETSLLVSYEPFDLIGM